MEPLTQPLGKVTFLEGIIQFGQGDAQAQRKGVAGAGQCWSWCHGYATTSSFYTIFVFFQEHSTIYMCLKCIFFQKHIDIYIYINQRSAQNHSLPGMAPTAAAASTPIRTVKKPLQPVSEKKGFTPIRSPLLKKVKREVPREALYCENMTFVLLTSVKQNYCSINSSPLLHMPMPAR